MYTRARRDQVYGSKQREYYVARRRKIQRFLILNNNKYVAVLVSLTARN